MQMSIAARIERTEEKVEAACLRSGRKRKDVALMAVTKFRPIEAVEAVWNSGIRLFGESRVQEGLTKYRGFWETHPRGGEASLHLVGSLQRNKAKGAVPVFDCIQSVDRDSLIETLGALTAGRDTPLTVLLEYHTGENSKAGYKGMDNLVKAAEKLLSFPGLWPAGLMTMAPLTDDRAAVRSSFRQLAGASDELRRRFPLHGRFAGTYFLEGWSCLSMGMTNDYEIAIEEGSTLIRLGTAIFGELVS